MTSQIGSLARGARSAWEAGRSVNGEIRSAILTYFGQIVIRLLVGTTGSCGRTARSGLRRRRRRALMGGETYRVSARDAKQARRTEAPRRKRPWLSSPMTAWRA